MIKMVFLLDSMDACLALMEKEGLLSEKGIELKNKFLEENISSDLSPYDRIWMSLTDFEKKYIEGLAESGELNENITEFIKKKFGHS